MYLRKKKGPLFVKLDNGQHLCRADLPPASTTRWVASRKAKVVVAIESGLISAKEACETYDLSEEELENWRGLAKRYGVSGLKATAARKNLQP